MGSVVDMAKLGVVIDASYIITHAYQPCLLQVAAQQSQLQHFACISVSLDCDDVGVCLLSGKPVQETCVCMRIGRHTNVMYTAARNTSARKTPTLYHTEGDTCGRKDSAVNSGRRSRQ